MLAPMLRRARMVLGYMPTNPDTDPSLSYSPFGWNYLLPQGMHTPFTTNRSASPAPRRRGPLRAYRGVWIDTEIHPSFRAALHPFLKRLILTHHMPRTPLKKAVAAYTENSAKVGDVKSRHGWLAKIAQLSGVKKTAASVLTLWSQECHAQYVTGTAVPPTSLALAMCYCTAAAKVPEYRSFFNCCLKTKWNVTPHFPVPLWSEVLHCAGRMGDEEGVLSIIDEMVDLQVNFEVISAPHIVWAINAVHTKEGYERVKKFLFLLSKGKVESVFRHYVTRRVGSEQKPDKSSFKENDNMFYHVHWHNSIRQPLGFNPRRLYFDFLPSSGLEDIKSIKKKSVDTLIAERVQKWKDQGLVPQDYQDNQKVVDVTEKFKYWQRQERWKKKPTWLEKHKSYTPYEAAK
jgi:hypothetical protein